MNSLEAHHELLAHLEWNTDPQLWIGDGRSLKADGLFWGAAVTELASAPALQAGAHLTRAGQEQRRLAERIVRSIRVWENAGSLEIRYMWGDQSGNCRLRLLLIGRALGPTLDMAHSQANQMLNNVVSLFPSGYTFGPILGPTVTTGQAWVEIERTQETRVPGPYVPPGMADYYYLLHPLGGSGVGWDTLPKALANLEEPGFLSIVLQPTKMTDLERRAVDHIISLARYLAEPQHTYDYFGNQITNPPDAGASAVQNAWQCFSQGAGVLARIGVAANQENVHRIASLVGAIIADGSGQLDNSARAQFNIVDNIGDFEAFQTATMGLVYPRNSHEIWSRPISEAPVSVERLPYFFSWEEGGGLFVLPVPDEQGIPGIARTRRQVERRESLGEAVVGPAVDLGYALHYGDQASNIAVPLAAFTQHTLVAGASGWGKTTTILSLLARLWRDHHIPFFAIEPTKTEYRSLLGTPGFEDLRIVSLGRDDVAPLRLNPMQPPPGVRAEVHANAVLSALKLALPLSAPLPALLDKAIEHAYQTAGWDYDTTVEVGLRPPTLRSLSRSFDTVFAGCNYRGDALNIGSAFSVRLGTLLRGSRGRVLDTVESVRFDELMQGPVVVELDEISDDVDKSVFSAFLLDRIRSSARARGSTGGELRHVTVIEEAHRLLSRGNQSSGSVDDGDMARASTVRAFCDAIAELRSVGEGFILSSHSPADLARAAIGNTATRIIHHLEQAADRAAVLDDFDASEVDRSIAARLRKGEAIARWPGQDEPELLRVMVADGVDSGRVVSNATVMEHMAPITQQVTSMVPYALCTRSMCTSGCDSGVRLKGQHLAVQEGNVANAHWTDAEGSVAALDPIIRHLHEVAEGDRQLTYCTAVHLAISGHAFNVRRNVDIQPRLIESVRRDGVPS